MTIWKKALIAIGMGIFALLILLAIFSQHRADKIVSAVANRQFYIEGELGSFSDPREIHFRRFVEYEMGTEHGIKNENSSYYAEGSQYYYGEDENNQREIIPEEHNPEEIFSRESVISNRDFSQLNFCCEGSDKIMDFETLEQIFCHYEEYCFKDTGDLIRFYFRGDQLYAMQTKKDARYVFYVSVFSEEPQKFLDDAVFE